MLMSLLNFADNTNNEDTDAGKFFWSCGKTKLPALSSWIRKVSGHTASLFSLQNLLPSLSSFFLGRTNAPYSAHQYDVRRGARKLKRSLALTLALLLSASPVKAEIPNFERLADAIYRAEGGNNTKHPYGILVRYKKTTPRQACLNTLRNKYKAWAKTDRKTPYLTYLASKYAPVGAKNDPTGLNKNWLRNVTYFLNKYPEASHV